VINQEQQFSKVFCLGLSKTGTTSMGKYFSKLGYRVCQENVNKEHEIDKINKFCDQKVNQYDMFQDLPWPITFSRYIDQYPDSKYILTYRSLDRWLNSMSIYSDNSIPLHQAIYGNSIFKNNEIEFRDFYINHIRNIVNAFQDNPGRLLMINIENDNWYITKALQGFLGISVEDKNMFPVSNKGSKNAIKWYIYRRKWKKLASSARFQ
jgi:hypothetical protein